MSIFIFFTYLYTWLSLYVFFILISILSFLGSYSSYSPVLRGL
ncbi:hypothetical protein BMETH_1179_1 [methanotrophic bacterial endosymbiont of Bathymodiolus sp.]|nr:hypothetical protein BMETH_1179_1 [methanotrophic bacterial endosymbiont of Bathymodiolus sp.]